MQKAIGVFGGTFNPIHLGHLKVAKSAMEECNLSKVIFLPNGNPPHKSGEYIAPAHHRYNMIKLAIDGIDGFCVSDYELKREDPSYTIDTNRAFKSMYNCPVFFIIGADSLHTLSEWKSYNDLILECKFIVAARSGEDFPSLLDACYNHNQKGGSATPLSMEICDVTSTDIRRFIQENTDVKALMPEAVTQYIKEHNLY